MRSRRTAQEETARIARRRLEQLTAELAGIRGSLGQTAAVEADQAVGMLAPPATGREDAVFEDPAASGDGPSRGRHARRPISPGGRVGGWVYDRLPPTLQGRFRLTAGHLTVVALLVAAGFAVTAWWAVRAHGEGTVVPASTWSDRVEGSPAPDQPTALVTPVVGAASDAPQGDPAVVVVDVAGKVRRPGIVKLPVGARVVDAIEAAGGARRGVDLSQLNLARVLVDGEQVVVGIPPPGGVAAPAASAPGAPSGAAGPLVNINSATQSQLEELPGVGPVTAAAILQWRSDNGAFTAVDELLEVSGIGDATLAKIAPFVTL